MQLKKMLVTAGAALGALAVVGVSQANDSPTGTQAARIIQAPQPLAAGSPGPHAQQIADAAQGNRQSAEAGNAVTIAADGVSGSGTTKSGTVKVNYTIVDGVLRLFSTDGSAGTDADTKADQKGQQVLVCSNEPQQAGQAQQTDKAVVQIKLTGWAVQSHTGTAQPASAGTTALIAQPNGDVSLNCTPS